MKKRKSWLVALLVAFLGLIFINLSSDSKADASSWYEGVPEFLTDDYYYDDDGTKVNFDDDSISIESENYSIYGNDLYYRRAAGNIYYIYAYNDNDDTDDDSGDYQTYFKVKVFRDGQIKIYANNDGFENISYTDSLGVFYHYDYDDEEYSD